VLTCRTYLLAKGRPPLPAQPIADVIDMPYTGNKLHPTQKSVQALAPLVRSFTLPGELVRIGLHRRICWTAVNAR